jgi:hypothetical protein
MATALGSSVAGIAAASAQDPSRWERIQDRLGAGFYAGISFASFVGDDIDASAVATHTKLAPTFGALLALEVSERFDLQGELALASKGAGFTDENGIDGTTNLYYLELPLLARAKLPLRRVTLYGQGGLSLAVLVEGRTEDEFRGRVDVAPTTESADVGFVLGAGAGFGGERRRQLFLELRYEAGLRNIDEPPAGPDRDARNSVFSLLAGCGF